MMCKKFDDLKDVRDKIVHPCDRIQFEKDVVHVLDFFEKYPYTTTDDVFFDGSWYPQGLEAHPALSS